VTESATAPPASAASDRKASRRDRAHSWFKHVRTSVGTWQLRFCTIAALTLAVMYCLNDNFDKHPEASRGDGIYRPVLARGDGHMHFLFTRSMVFDRDTNLDNDLARLAIRGTNRAPSLVVNT
jgi:hypothetical protein